MSIEHIGIFHEETSIEAEIRQFNRSENMDFDKGCLSLVDWYQGVAINGGLNMGL
jgi:hypothetical protein